MTLSVTGNVHQDHTFYLQPHTPLHQWQLLFVCLSTQINLLFLLLPSSHFFQLIFSFLALQSDLNHLIGVSIWVSDWPSCPLAWLFRLWLYTEHNAVFSNKVAWTPIPSMSCYVWKYCLLLPAFLCFSVIAIICYSCLSSFASLFTSSSWPHPSTSCRGMLKPVKVSNEGGPLGIHVVPFSLQDVR